MLGTGRPITISGVSGHDVAALLITSRVLAGPVVAWVEDGRLILVAGDASTDELIALAESVRPATSGEWRRAGLTDLREIGDVIIDLGDSVELYRDVNPVTDGELAVTVQFIDGAVLICVQERSDIGLSTCETNSAGLPLLTTIEATGQTYVVAIVDRSPATGAELRIKLAEGTWTLPLDYFGAELPGLAVATLLPTDYGVIELWSNGELVAAT